MYRKGREAEPSSTSTIKGGIYTAIIFKYRFCHFNNFYREIKYWPKLLVKEGIFMMLERILKLELELFQKLLDVEKEKRNCILSANGKEILRLTELSAKYLHEFEVLESSRQTISAKTIISPEILKKYEKTVLALKELVAANQTLLKDTNLKIKSMMSDLQREGQRKKNGDIYKPVPPIGKEANLRVEASLLNKSL